MYDTLIQYIRTRVEITDAELGPILSQFTPITAEKNRILLSKGNICEYLYFVSQGTLRTYYTNRTGIEITRFIVFEGSFIAALSSFMTQKPSIEAIEALEKSEVLAIKYLDFYKLLETNTIWEKIYRTVLEQKHISDTKHLNNISTQDVKTRYYHLSIQEPSLHKRLEDRIIASYLGISLNDLKAFKNN